jgi:hypothetical protein
MNPGAPACDTMTNRCVACLTDSDCAGNASDGGAQTPYCRTGGGFGGFTNQCVACLAPQGDAGTQGCAAGQMCIGGSCR